MSVVSVCPRETPGFLAYCAAHRFDHDESFLDEHSLSLFVAGLDEETAILMDEENAVIDRPFDFQAAAVIGLP
jgi:hypothetical protein